jgi:hypothetical protein
MVLVIQVLKGRHNVKMQPSITAAGMVCSRFGDTLWSISSVLVLQLYLVVCMDSASVVCICMRQLLAAYAPSALQEKDLAMFKERLRTSEWVLWPSANMPVVAQSPYPFIALGGMIPLQMHYTAKERLVNKLPGCRSDKAALQDHNEKLAARVDKLTSTLQQLKAEFMRMQTQQFQGAGMAAGTAGRAAG